MSNDPDTYFEFCTLTFSVPNPRRHINSSEEDAEEWIPAFAGMTENASVPKAEGERVACSVIIWISDWNRY